MDRAKHSAAESARRRLGVYEDDPVVGVTILRLAFAEIGDAGLEQFFRSFTTDYRELRRAALLDMLGDIIDDEPRRPLPPVWLRYVDLFE